MDFYVYELLDPFENYTPFYVGKGRGARVRHHYSPSYVAKKSHKSHVIRRYRKAGFEDEYVLVASRLTEEESFEIEKKLIAIAGLKRSGGLLVNISLGGEGSSGCNQPKTLKHKVAISAAKKGRPFSDEHKKALSLAAKGKVISPEHRNNISKAMKGYVPTKAHKEALSKSQKGKPKKAKNEHNFKS